MKKQHHWTGRKHTEETKAKMRSSMLNRVNPMKNAETVLKRTKTLVANGSNAGENNHKWKGGDRKYRGLGWNNAKKERRMMDNYKCFDCGKPESEMKIALDVHHIIEFKDGGSNEMSNLRSLCRSCHNKRRKKCQKV